MPDDPPAPARTTGEATYFDSERAREIRSVGVEKARNEALERRAEILERIAVSTELVAAYEGAYPNGLERAKLYKAAADRIAHDVLSGKADLEKWNGSQMAAMMNALVNAGRLEAGEVTSSTESIPPEERAERMRILREEFDRQQDDAEKAAQAGRVVPLADAGRGA